MTDSTGLEASPTEAQQESGDGRSTNQAVAARFLDTARLLENQGANPFRVRAYRRAAQTLRRLRRPVEQILREEGPGGLDRLSGIGPGLAAAIRDFVATGRMPLQERLARTRSPFGELCSIPGIGPVLAQRLHEELEIATLEDLEVSAYSGRLERVTGIGPRRLEGIRLALVARLGRTRPGLPIPPSQEAPIADVLDVDREYRELAATRRLPTIAPRRMNPRNQAWLPILHTRRGPRHYTALFSNTPRAHQLGRTRDWVVVYFGEYGARGQHTIVTESAGALRGERVVRGREAECAAHYERRGTSSIKVPRVPA
jgi:DNA polymerase (family 10)